MSHLLKIARACVLVAFLVLVIIIVLSTFLLFTPVENLTAHIVSFISKDSNDGCSVVVEYVLPDETKITRKTLTLPSSKCEEGHAYLTLCYNSLEHGSPNLKCGFAIPKIGLVLMIVLSVFSLSVLLHLFRKINQKIAMKDAERASIRASVLQAMQARPSIVVTAETSVEVPPIPVRKISCMETTDFNIAVEEDKSTHHQVIIVNPAIMDFEERGK